MLERFLRSSERVPSFYACRVADVGHDIIFDRSSERYRLDSVSIDDETGPNTACSLPPPQSTMPPAEFFVRLQHGITGGFAPPTPSALYTLAQSSGAPSLAITAAVREDGTPSLTDAAPKTLTPDSTTAALVDELHGILKTIPTESPPGSEDIYGLDTSIAWGSDDLEWYNGGPAGCGGGNSMGRRSEAISGDRNVVAVYQDA
uniref:Uncharacterized protein n=1 Tax=Mycena chlorophos TaxID=658473 RepID=A0ABQ0M1F4_MYCCL|nr:predicted protein [Mycena chlorophos]